VYVRHGVRLVAAAGHAAGWLLLRNPDLWLLVVTSAEVTHYFDDQSYGRHYTRKPGRKGFVPKGFPKFCRKALGSY
jgi:hypothetical protein